MRKLFLALVLSLCMLDSGAFAATGRANARGSSVSARAAVQQKQQGVVSRAATKKAATMGTKVVAATENTAVSQECQNAYYGCMDAFCMLDNAAGGRCQCSDRGAELDAVLDEIMRIDEQSALIASEGVEQIQMGEYADQINNVTKSIETELDTLKTKTSVAKHSSSSSTLISSTGGLDLSAWSNNGMNGDIFSVQARVNPIDDIAGKTGDKLQKAAASICVTQMPKECQNSSSLLQMAYIQKIKSDCIGYENALKQQRNISQQNLLAAQKAVRDAALAEVRRQNTYETTGECAVAFAQCMQTTAGCKSDYTGCVTLAAAENMKNNSAGSKAKQTKIKGVVSGADITLAATTMEQLLSKKEICASVTKQCVNANKNDAVWDVFLRNAAPALKSAELIAEQDLRSNCISTAAECFKNACKSQFGENNDNYDMCLSNPATYKSFCKVQLEPCLEATGGSYDEPTKSTLWNGLIAMLSSMKVDACTQEVKDCLLSEDRCGKDYSGCIGLSTQSIGELCPVEKLTACMTNYNKDTVREYVAEVAQGLALNIDNSFLTQCQNIANEALIKVCGDTESCEDVMVNLDILDAMVQVQACKWDDAKGTSKTCLPDVSQFGDDEVYAVTYSVADDATLEQALRTELRRNNNSSYGVYATLLNVPDVSSIIFNNSDNGSDSFVLKNDISDDEVTKEMVEILNANLNTAITQIETDPKVIFCKSGHKVQGFDNSYFIKTKGQEGRFPNLTEEYKYIIANGLLNKLGKKNAELSENFAEQIDEINNKITERVMQIAQKRGAVVEEVVDKRNEEACNKYKRMQSLNERSDYNVESAYDINTNICTVRYVKYSCKVWRHRRCYEYDTGTVTNIQEKQMPKFKL